MDEKQQGIKRRTIAGGGGKGQKGKKEKKKEGRPFTLEGGRLWCVELGGIR